ncbi:MAG: hypothetical protein JNK78_00315, partial [Planctomycetes bacterium]|nr:hypothetical protein [Planctomycetota bacterium]
MLQRRGDHRSDIYSAGVMLYELLCSRVPFTGDSEWEVLRQHETKAPDLPPHLSPVERSVLQRCLQKDPAARFQSVQDLIAALGAAPGARPAAAPPAAARPVPPPLPRDVPPPLPVDPPPPVDAHLAGFGKASREAAHHAKFVARHAIGRARIFARRTATRAHERTRVVLERLRSVHRRRSVTNDTVPTARPRRGVPRASTVAMVVAMVMFFAIFLSGRPVRVDMAPSMPYAATSSQQLEIPTGTVYGTHFVPARYQDAVTKGVPSWVSMYDSDPQRARKALLERVQLLREIAPLSENSSVQADELPSFTMRYDFVPFVRAHQVSFDALLRGREYPEDIAESLAERGHIAIVAAADLLARIQWDRPSDVERAGRLHRFLAEATGCRDIEWQGSAGQVTDVGRANRLLGVLWVWFANEFARDERTWATFRAIFPPH